MIKNERLGMDLCFWQVKGLSRKVAHTALAFSLLSLLVTFNCLAQDESLGSPDGLIGQEDASAEATGCNAVLYVCPSFLCPFRTIQAAIDSPSAGSCTTIFVLPGHYSGIGGSSGGGITFRGKSLHVQSTNGQNETFIDGMSGPAVQFENGESNSSILEGFTISPPASGPTISIFESAPTIKNCTMSGYNSPNYYTSTAIDISASAFHSTAAPTQLIANRIFSYYTGIRVSRANISVLATLIAWNRRGISFHYNSNALIERSTIANNQEGMRCDVVGWCGWGDNLSVLNSILWSSSYNDLSFWYGAKSN